MTQAIERKFVSSDSHRFVGRIFGLSIVGLHCAGSEELEEHPDAQYVLLVNEALTNLVARVESLNHVGDALWLENPPSNLSEFPINAYTWLTLIWDAFLLRYISVVDCAAILVDSVFETEIPLHTCGVGALKKKKIPTSVLEHIVEAVEDQGKLRLERNARTHHGLERSFTADDHSFRFTAMMAQIGRPVSGKDFEGKEPDVVRYFSEAVSTLQAEYNEALLKLDHRVGGLYSELEAEFEARFVPRFRAGKFSNTNSDELI